MRNSPLADLSTAPPEKLASLEESGQASSPPRLAPILSWRKDAQLTEALQLQTCSAKQSALSLQAKVSRNHLASNLAHSLSFSSLDYFVGYHNLQFDKVLKLAIHVSNKANTQLGSRLSPHRRRTNCSPSFIPLDYHLVRLLSDIDSLLGDLPQYAFKTKQEKEFYQEKFKEHAGDPHGLAQAISNLRQRDWRSVSKLAFVSLATEQRLTSTALQLYLEQGDSSPGLMQLIEASKAELIKDKLGCHVLRRMVPKSRAFASSLVRFIESSIVDLACNEYSSRVLQALAAAEAPFACRFIRVFLDHWKLLAGHISAVFLFSVCLQLVPKLDAGVAEVGTHLLRISADPMNGRNNKRVLVSFLEYCDCRFVAEFYEILAFDTRFIERMDDKYMVYIFSVFLARGYRKVESSLICNCKESFAALLKTSFFRLLVNRIFMRASLQASQTIICHLLSQFVVQIGFRHPTQVARDLRVGRLLSRKIADQRF